MEGLFPLLFVLYILSTIVSAVLKRRRFMERGPRPVEVPFPPFDPLELDEAPRREGSNVDPPFSLPKGDGRKTTGDTQGEPEDRNVTDRLAGVELAAPLSSSSSPRRAQRGRFGPLTAHDLRRGVVWAEIVGAPRALRPYTPPHIKMRKHL